MKNSFLIPTLVLSGALPTLAMAATPPSRTCAAEVRYAEDPTIAFPISVQIYEGKAPSAVFQRSTEKDGAIEIEASKEEPVEISQLTVGKEALDAAANIVKDPAAIGKQGRNLAEDLIIIATWMTEEPMFKGLFSLGFDLKKVRSARVFRIGRPSPIGNMAVVECKDESGKILGSFFYSPLSVSSCK